MGYSQLDGLSEIVAGVRGKLYGTEGVNMEEICMGLYLILSF